MVHLKSQVANILVQSGDKLLKLHLGCFDFFFPGWVNTDASHHILLSKIPYLPDLLFLMGLISKERILQYRGGLFKRIKYMNVTKKFPFGDNQVDYVFSSHMIQKIDRDETLFCFREIYRILKPGGCFRVSTPDLDRLVADYRPDDADNFLVQFFSAGQRRNQNRNKYQYNEMTLGKLLCESGFDRPYRCEYQQGQCADLGTIDNRPDSLFMEATKR